MKSAIILTVLFSIFAFTINAQNDTMYVFKKGIVTHKISIKKTDVDSIIFYSPYNFKDIDGNVYNIVTIGTQVWMKENLRTTRYADGTAIPLVKTNSSWDSLITTSKGYCWYNDDIANKASYGALYTWAAAMNGAASSNDNPSKIQGVCPTGWHLPSEAEWAQLADYLGGSGVAGLKLKEKGTSHWTSPNTGATNESRFTALPGGYRNGDGAFIEFKNYGYWWGASEYDDKGANGCYLTYNYGDLGRITTNKAVGFSVRCLRSY